MSDPIADLLAAQAKGVSGADSIGAMLHAQAKAAPAQPAVDPSEGRLPFAPFGIDTGLTMPQGVSRFMAGAGKAFVDLGRGAGQLVGAIDRKDIDDAKRLDAPLMKTGAGTAGNVVGNMAALAPTVMLPGAATIGGGALIGAGSSALQPVGTGESRLQNMVVGAAGGAAVPAAIRTTKVLKAGLVDPFTEAGRQRIVGNVLAKSAANPQQAAQGMLTVQGVTPGFQPTAAQASGDSGIAAIERTARAIDPAGFGDVDQAQRGALVNALRGVAGTPEQRAAAVSARDDAASALYGQAFEGDRMRQSLAAADTAARAPFSGAGLNSAAPDLATPGLRNLASRPIFQDAIEQAKALAANNGNPLADPLQSLQGLHYVKLALDDMGSPGAASALGRNANAAVNNTKAALTAELEKVSPLYGNARSAYAEMSQPINQMDVGQELYNRFVPALSDNAVVPFKTRADAYAQALRNGDQLAQNVTGLKGATMEGIMTPEQMSALHGVSSDAALIGAAQNAGRGTGSDTVQKMAMSNLIDQAGLPTWVSALAPLRSIGGMARTAGDILYTKNDETLRHLLADVLKNPTQAAAVLQKSTGTTPAAYARLLRMTGQDGALGMSMTANASK